MRSVLLQFANFRVKTEDLYEEVKKQNSFVELSDLLRGF